MWLHRRPHGVTWWGGMWTMLWGDIVGSDFGPQGLRTSCAQCALGAESAASALRAKGLRKGEAFFSETCFVGRELCHNPELLCA